MLQETSLKRDLPEQVDGRIAVGVKRKAELSDELNILQKKKSLVATA